MPAVRFLSLWGRHVDGVAGYVVASMVSLASMARRVPEAATGGVTHCSHHTGRLHVLRAQRAFGRAPRRDAGPRGRRRRPSAPGTSILRAAMRPRACRRRAATG